MRKERNKVLLALLLAFTLVFGSVAPAMSVNAGQTKAGNNYVFEEVDEEVGAQTEYGETEEAISEEDLISDDETVRVFIVFEKDSVIEAGYSTENLADNAKAEKYADKLENVQEQVIEKIEEQVLDGEALDTRYSFTIIANAVSANVTYGEVENIEAIDGVEAVYVAPVYEVQATAADKNTMTSGDMVGSYNTWLNGYTGLGQRIAVIDTGLDTDHPSFDEAAFLNSVGETAAKAGRSVESYDLLDEEEIAGVVDRLNASNMYEGLTASDLYRTAKVCFGFCYVDEDLDITHDNDTQGEHGTHVSGIATANKYVDNNGEYTSQKNGVVGIAPDAQLMVMKVFGNGGGAYSDDYMAAIEDAILLGADSINLSLGSSSAGETAAGQAFIDDVFNNLAATDTVVSISAGNASNWSKYSQYGANLTTDVDADTCGSPGSYTNAFTVASANNSGYTAFSAQFGDLSVYYNSSSNDKNIEFNALDETGNGTEFEYVLLDSFGAAEDYEGIDVTGKIVLVSRGSLTFSEKHMNAYNAGAAGLFVYNNTTGSIGMDISDSTAPIPAASILQSEAAAIREISEYNEETKIYTGKVVVSSKETTNYNAPDGYLMSDFSSWGVPGDLTLKPEITAPGGNIYSTLDDGKYGLMSGTSMAAPSVCGMSALVLQYIEENNLAEKTGLSARALAQSLLMSTATPLTQADGNLYSPRKQGSGLANVEAATTSPVYILVGSKDGNDGKVKAELGDDPARKGVYSFDFTLYNMSNEKQYFFLDEDILTESVLQDYFIANNSYVLSPNVSYSYSNKQLVYDINGDKKVDKMDAKALLKFVNGSAKYSIVNSLYDEYDLNKNGIVDTDDVTLLQKAIKKGNKSDLNLKKTCLMVKDTTKVEVTISLSDSDKNYIENNFENGMYVEGFIELDGVIDLSLPLLAFYGNWTDSSMFEAFDTLAYYNGNEDQMTYSGVAKTNFLTYKFPGDTTTYYFMGNMYEKDNEYIADRNAISSLNGTTIGAFGYTLIRNASAVTATITDAETGEEYVKVEKGSAIGTYYSASAGQWYNTLSNATLNWKGTDAEGKALADGTKVNITLTAIPAYYKNGDKELGKGATISIPMTIDNTNPTCELVSVNEEDQTMDIKVSDNRYAAAVYVYAADKKTLISSSAVNQTELGKDVTLTLGYEKTVFYVQVLDYAGNSTVYRVNLSGIEDTEVVESIALDQTSISLMKGDQAVLAASLLPIQLITTDVEWTSSDESIARVDASGCVYGVGEGTTTITATTVAKNSEGVSLTASCEVTVFSLDVDLCTTLWDENGSVYFGSFNTSKLPELNKLSGPQSVPFWSAAVVGDKLYVSDYTDDQTASLYVVDPANGYSVEALDGSTYWSTDMAYGKASGQLLGTYGNYLVINDLDGNMATAYSLSNYIGSASMVGIAYAGSSYSSAYSMYIDWFYIICDDGELFQIGYLKGLGYYCYDLGNTGTSTNGKWYYDSLYYDFETGFLFYTCYDGSSAITLYAILDDYNAETDEEVITTFVCGQFADDVWPISGLYQWNNDGSVGDATSSRSEKEALLEDEVVNSIPKRTLEMTGKEKNR